MTEVYKPHRPTAVRLFRQIGSRYALSNQTLLLFAIPAFGSGLIFDLLRLEGPLAIRVLVTTAGYFATIVPLLIARIFLPDRPRESRPVAIVVVFLLAGVVRGATLLGLGIINGEYEPGDEIFRLVGAPVFTFAMLSVSAVLASNYRRHREVLDELATERYKLQLRSAGIAAKVELQREELLAKIRSLLDPAIKKVQQSLVGQSAVESLRATVDEVVRPLSLEVARSSDELELDASTSQSRERAQLPKRLILGDFLLPLWGTLIAAVALISVTFLIETPLNALLILVSIFVSMFLTLGVMQLATKNISVPAVLAIVLVPILYAVSIIPFQLLAPLAGWRVSSEQLVVLSIFNLILGSTTFFAQLVQLLRRGTTERLANVNQQLEILNAALRQELWLNRRRAASVLHGPVQAALYASAMKLSQAGEPSAKLIAEVELDIQAALEKLNNPSNLELESIASVLGQITDLWSDAAKITIEIAPDLEQQIASQPLAAEALLEIVREFVTNAIKHGSATKVDVKISRIDDHRFAIDVSDNGSGPKPGSGTGFGSKLLSELSLSWSQKRVADTTLSYAEVVLGRDNL